MRGLVAAPFAFMGALAWYLWTTTGQSAGACFSYAHYVPSAAVAFVIITGLAIVTDRLAMARPRPPVLSAVTAAAIVSGALTAVSLAAAIFFSAAVSCSGG